MSTLRDQYLIEPAALAQRLSDSDVQVFDAAVSLQVRDGGFRAVSGFDDYQAAHIPGAGFLDLIQALSDTESGLGFTLPAPAELARRVGAAGVRSDATVVLYSSGHLMWATRAFWLLRYLGHDRVQVMNGGLAAWQKQGQPTDEGAAAVAAANFQHSVRPELFVTLEEMRSLVEAGQVQTTCALSADVYQGDGDFHYGRRGHIPGSTHLHYEDLLQDGSLLPTAELLGALERGNFASSERVVSYCGGGIAATILAFARLISDCGATGVYDGSMSEWVRAGLPLTTGAVP
ncbi:MAG: sulfurtransferase [Pseudomonadales bacterium]